MKIVIPGGTGQVGTVLARALRADGHQVVVLTRRAGGEGQISWDGERLGPWAREVDGSGAPNDDVTGMIGGSEDGVHVSWIHEDDFKSRRVIPGLLTAAGFEFRHGTWPEACRDLVERAISRDTA